MLGEFEQLVLLALLRLGNGAYGASIRREIRDRTKRDVPIGSVYVTLARLERKEMVVSYVGLPSKERGGRRRKHYLMNEPASARSAAPIARSRRCRRGSRGSWRSCDPWSVDRSPWTGRAACDGGVEGAATSLTAAPSTLLSRTTLKALRIPDYGPRTADP